METSALFGLSAMLSQACTAAIIASRARLEYGKDYKPVIENLIISVLDRLSSMGVEQSENELRAMIMLLEDPGEVILTKSDPSCSTTRRQLFLRWKMFGKHLPIPGCKAKLKDIIRHIQF
ncbi:MAG: hypothetical protein R2850_04105 [Bacteroidia bacterium]